MKFIHTKMAFIYMKSLFYGHIHPCRWIKIKLNFKLQIQSSKFKFYTHAQAILAPFLFFLYKCNACLKNDFDFFSCIGGVKVFAWDKHSSQHNNYEEGKLPNSWTSLSYPLTKDLKYLQYLYQVFKSIECKRIIKY
jgi:hypothetical protein